jgi:branched-subunit amino acid transport protein
MMESGAIWLTITGLTLVTVVTRNLFLALGHKVALPERVQHALRYAPACALVALIVPEIVLQSGTLALSFTNAKFVAALVAVAALLLTRRAVLAILFGMAAFTLVRLL